MPSRVRRLVGSAGGPRAIIAVVVVTVIVWRLALGWNWSSVPSSDPLRNVAPQTGFDWLLMGLVIVAGVSWLSWLGHSVTGTAAVWTTVVVLSAWRLAASGILGWPISLAALIFIVSAICTVAALAGTWLRHRAEVPVAAAENQVVRERPKIQAGPARR